MLIPVAEYNPFCATVAEVNVVNSRSMRVAVQQDVDTMLDNHLLNFVLVNVRDPCARRRVFVPAFCTRVGGKRQSFRQRLREHHCLPFRVACHRTDLLILEIIGAHGVAMTQQDGCAVQFDRVWIGENLYACLVSKVDADHEVAIAVHEVDGHARIDQRTQGALHCGVVFIRIIVA